MYPDERSLTVKGFCSALAAGRTDKLVTTADPIAIAKGFLENFLRMFISPDPVFVE